MNPTIRITALAAAVALSSCSMFNKDENYDTATGYNTSDPYGVPSSGGYESAPYQEVNAPASDPSYGGAAYEESSTPSAPAAAPEPSPAPIAAASGSGSSHTVVKGDTLWGISRKYNVSIDKLRAANSMAATDSNVRLGQTLIIPSP